MAKQRIVRQDTSKTLCVTFEDGIQMVRANARAISLGFVLDIMPADACRLLVQIYDGGGGPDDGPIESIHLDPWIPFKEIMKDRLFDLASIGGTLDYSIHRLLEIVLESDGSLTFSKDSRGRIRVVFHFGGKKYKATFRREARRKLFR